jgi:hypothetical protein
MRDPRFAPVLCAFIPGVGQVYNGSILAGILGLIITPGLWIGMGERLTTCSEVGGRNSDYKYGVICNDERLRDEWARGPQVLCSLGDALLDVSFGTGSNR